MATSKGGDSGAKEVQAKVDAETDLGYHGTTVDDTPNEAYTVQGVIEGAETPEATPTKDPDATYAGDKPLGESKS